MLSIICFFFLHEFYVSVSYMEYDNDRNAVEIQKKIFFDDLELVLRKENNNKTFDILNSDPQLINQYIETYLISNMKIFINGKIYNFNYLGHEYVNGTINCFLEIKGIRKVKELQIEDTSLFSYFDGQENLIYFEMNNKLSTLRLKEPKLSDKIIF